jgi:acetylornithine deacetylase/succinyl-diaminopimelate desuccinylase-like protein
LNVFESESVPGNAADVYGRAVARATLDARLLPEHDPDELLRKFERKAQEWVQGLGTGELSVQIEVTRNAGGMSLRDDAKLVAAVGRVLSRAGLDPTPRAKPTSTEAGVFARAGCEAVVIGPGRSTGNAHEPNERIEIAQPARAIDLYEQILLELCG